MHEYYAKKAPKLKKAMNGLLKPISGELEKHSGKPFSVVFAEIWEHYEKNMMENFPYIGGDAVSGTSNLTGAYCFVSMGEVLKQYDVSMEEIGHLMVLAYERRFQNMPGIIKTVAHKSYTNVRSLNKKFQKKDARNAVNAAKYPGSFETKTMIPPERNRKKSPSTFSDFCIRRSRRTPGQKRQQNLPKKLKPRKNFAGTKRWSKQA